MAWSWRRASWRPSWHCPKPRAPRLGGKHWNIKGIIMQDGAAVC
jgi:hypothetical protein